MLRRTFRNVSADALEDLNHFRLLGRGQIDNLAMLLPDLALRLVKDSASQGFTSAAALPASVSIIFCRSPGSASNHFLDRKAIEKMKGWLVSVMYLAAS